MSDFRPPELGHTTFKNIVDRVIDEADYPLSATPKILEIALRAWRDITRTTSRDVVTRFFKVDASLPYIVTPPDYENYTKIGILVRNGHGNEVIMTLSRNDELCAEDMAPPDAQIVCDCEEEPETISDAIQVIASGGVPYGEWATYRKPFRRGQAVGELYGMQGGRSMMGAFRPREDQGKIWLSSDVPFHLPIALEYRSSMMNGGPNTRIPFYLESYLIAQTKFLAMNNRNSTLGDRREAQSLADRYHGLAESFVAAPAFDEAMDQLYGMNSLTY